MTSESPNNVLKPEISKKIKRDLYNLIRRYCNSYKIVNFRYELFLHDTTRIEYEIIPILELEKLISLINKYWSYFSYLVSNLSFEEEKITVERNDRILGTINISKTIRSRINHQTNRMIVCSTNSKYIFTYENILLASLILSINLVASKFQRYGSDAQIEHFRIEHHQSLEKIIEYTQFLLRDKLLKKLVGHYLLNFENMEDVVIGMSQRINQGKIRIKYLSIIQFLKEWKSLTWMLNEPLLSFRESLTPYLDSIDEAKLYETWILYKIISLFEPIYQKNKNVFTNDISNFKVEYHQERSLEWQRDKKLGIPLEVKRYPVKRYPDITIIRNGRPIAIIDAKCTHYSEKEDDKQEPGPDRNIVNQMIIYLDYGKKCNLGIVLFADDKVREDVQISRGELRRILFLNCYPYHESASITLENIKNNLIPIRDSSR